METAFQQLQATLKADAVQRERHLMAAEQEVQRERQNVLFQTGLGWLGGFFFSLISCSLLQRRHT
jgi:hypothetical protein